MKNVASWLVTIFIVVFWIFRLVIAYLYSIGIEFAVKPLDMNTEILVLFISFFSILLFIARKKVGGILYFISYVYYFGMDAYNGVMNAINQNDSSTVSYTSTLVSCVAIILATSALMDVFLNKDRHEGKDNKDTHWFYKNKKYERKLDERADKNQYRIR